MAIRFFYFPKRKRALRVNQALMLPREARDWIKRQRGRFWKQNFTDEELKFLSCEPSQNFSLFVKLLISESDLIVTKT